MRFVCDSCRAQYMISDDKVGPKGVKVRCKKCGYVILVQRPDLSAASSVEGEHEHQPAHDAAPPPPVDEEPTSPGYLSQSRPPGKSILEGVADDEIGAVFDQVLSAGSAAAPEGESQQGLPLDPYDDRTREVDASLVQKLLEQSGPVQSTAVAREGQQNGAAHDWFVAIDEKQVGPLTFDKVKDLWDRGEIGPDSLCWRAGLSDWVTLSDTPELATLLAPKPVKPVIVAPAPVGGSSVPAGAPVESVFSVGASTKPPRAEAAPAASGAEEGGSWKPSAASALASLMKEEIEVLAKPPARAAAPDSSAGASRLLDLPPAQSNGRSPSSPSLRASAVEPNPARGFANTLASQPSYPSTYGSYPPKSSKKTIVFLSVGAGALLLALAVVTTILVIKPTEPGGDEVAPPKPKSTATKAGAARNQSDPGAKGEGTASAKQEAAVAKAEPTPSKTEAAAPAVKPDAAPKAEVAPPPTTRPERSSGTRRERGTRSGGHSGAGEEITVPKKADKPDAVARARPSAEDEFDKEFGSENKGAASRGGEPAAKKPAAVYVPPAPGAEIPESLGQSDIMQVVVANKPAILRCVTEQKKKDSNLSGRLVMRWTILTSGKTTNISCQSDEFKTSYMAQCIGGLIKSWQFPRHKAQGEPITFPFTF